VWGEVDGDRVNTRKVDKGAVYDGVELDEVLEDRGVPPDVLVIGGGGLICAAAGAGKIGIGDHGGIVFKHRSGSDGEVYFLSNTSNVAVDFTISLRGTGRRPSLWNAVTGGISDAAAFRQENGRTLIPLHLDASESVFIVLDGAIAPDTSGPAASNTPEYETVATLDGPWMVRFDGGDAPEAIELETLVDWSRHPDDRIKHHAGTGVYETSVTLPDPVAGKQVVLELGDVGVIATVLVNGEDAGTVWTAPWAIDITDLVVAGENDLEIRVANTWHNRLVADAARPVEERRSHVSQGYRFDARAPLHEAGLLGPVRIKRQK